MGFTGIPTEGIEFYERLGADNTKVFWQANRPAWAEHVRGPMTELCEALDDYGPFHLFRPHNDLRFSKNKPPYKIHQGAYAESEGGAGHYVQLSANGLMCGAGYYAMATDQLARFRAAVDDDTTGPEIAEIVADVSRRYTIGAIDELKTAPRGVAKGHPRIALMRRKGLMMSKDFGAPAWLHTKRVVAKVREVWRASEPMCAWLDHHVGPSTLPPPEFG